MTVRELHALLSDLVTVSPDARVLLMTDPEHVTDMGSIRAPNWQLDGETIVLLTPEPPPGR